MNFLYVVVFVCVGVGSNNWWLAIAATIFYAELSDANEILRSIFRNMPKK